MKILIVDDSRVARKTIALTIEALGFVYEEASTGNEALDILADRSDEFSLVILDWNMPGLSGIEVLRRIKRDARLKSIPVMMATTEMERSSMIEAVKAGAKHYVTKPFTPEHLSVRILQSLGVA